MDDTTSSPVKRALAVFDGSPTKMAAAVDPSGERVKRQHVEHWVKADRIPTDHIRAVERLTRIPAWEFRQDDWHLIWPELIHAPGAPKPPPPPPAANDERVADPNLSVHAGDT